MSNVKWEIPSRNRVCSKEQEVLAPGSAYYSVLRRSDRGDYQRFDYCEACWQVIQADATTPPHETQWRGMVPKRQEKKRNTQELSAHAVLQLRTCLESKEAEREQEAFALSVYLQRLRTATVRHTFADAGRSYQLLEIIESGETLAIPQVALTTDIMERLESRLQALLTPNDGV